jgi:dipeptidase E
MGDERLLLMSNSTMVGEKWLGWPEEHIKAFLGPSVKNLFFVPFAGVRMTWDEYAGMARERFGEMGYSLAGAHEPADPMAALAASDAVVIGGGNTWHLIDALHRTGLLEAIGVKVRGGAPFVGWSAGSNVACPSIRTTNDMAVVEPPSTKALGLVPFQINPHYTDAHPPGLGGETRADRILEFVEVNPDIAVVGLPEGDLLKVEGGSTLLVGSFPAKVFVRDREPWFLQPGETFSV